MVATGRRVLEGWDDGWARRRTVNFDADREDREIYDVIAGTGIGNKLYTHNSVVV